MRIEIPEFCLVALIGASSSGKTTFAKKHFRDTEVLSSDYFRSLIVDDERDQSISKDAFDALYYIANKRLDNGRLTVIDATNTKEESREKIISIAREQNCHAVAIVFNLPESICHSRNELRSDRQLPHYTISRHCLEVKKSIKKLKREGFRFVYVLNSVDDVENAVIERVKLWNDKKHEKDPLTLLEIYMAVMMN